MKKIISLLLVLIMIVLTVSCAKEVPNTETADKSASYPMTLKDQAGREVVISEKPEKLVSGYYISTSALIALGLEDKLVGIEAKAASREIYKLSAPDIISLPSVGTAKEFDLEGCAALEPDLVILPIKLKSAVEQLEALGITVLLVDPENSEKLLDMITLISKATDTVARGEEILDYISSAKSDIETKVNSKSAPTVYLAGNSSFLSTAGKNMYQNDMITLAGGKNVASEIDDTYWAEVSYEQVLLWDPEYIILAADAKYSVDEILNDTALSECTAVKKGNVYKLPNDAESWDSPVPAGFLGSVWVASVLHPDAVSESDALAVINGFYEEFYGFKYKEN